MCILFVLHIVKSCQLLLFECSVPISDGFPKKVCGWGGWGELDPVLFWIF